MHKCVNCGEKNLIQSDYIGDFCVYCYDNEEVKKYMRNLIVIKVDNLYYYHYSESDTAFVTDRPVSALNFRSVTDLDSFRCPVGRHSKEQFLKIVNDYIESYRG